MREQQTTVPFFKTKLLFTLFICLHLSLSPVIKYSGRPGLYLLLISLAFCYAATAAITMTAAET